jgi:hypothetical protein
MAIRKTTRGNTAPLARSDARPAASGEQMQDDAPPVKPYPALRAVALTRDLIAERAQAIWLKRGCPRNRDVENWREAEAELKVELGIV